MADSQSNVACVINRNTTEIPQYYHQTSFRQHMASVIKVLILSMKLILTKYSGRTLYMMLLLLMPSNIGDDLGRLHGSAVITYSIPERHGGKGLIWVLLVNLILIDLRGWVGGGTNFRRTRRGSKPPFFYPKPRLSGPQIQHACITH